MSAFGAIGSREKINNSITFRSKVFLIPHLMALLIVKNPPKEKLLQCIEFYFFPEEIGDLKTARRQASKALVVR